MRNIWFCYVPLRKNLGGRWLIKRSSQAKVTPIKMTQAVYISMMRQGFQRSSMCNANSPIYPFLKLTRNIQVGYRNTGPNIAAIQDERSYDTFIEIQSNFKAYFIVTMLSGKKFYKPYQGSSFLGGSFSLFHY